MTEKTFVEEIEKALEKSKGLNIKELLFSYQGTFYPTTVCSAETFQALENFEARKDDVVLVSYPKCGEYNVKGFFFFGCGEGRECSSGGMRKNDKVAFLRLCKAKL